MMRYHVGGQLLFIKKPIRVDLRFEKTFTMAILLNEVELLGLFPENQIKSVYVSMHQLADYKLYKDRKQHLRGQIKDQLTTPLHIAASKGCSEAVK